MKKTLLFIALCITTIAYAQERTVSIVGGVQQNPTSYASLKAIKAERAAGLAHKTTTTTTRWFSYADYFDTVEILSSGTPAIFAQYLWNDTMAIMAYGSSTATEWNHNRMVSMGIVNDPSFSGFNNVGLFPGMMEMTSGNAFAVDSIRVYGNYGFNPAKIGVVDTIRIAFAYALGASKTDDVYLAKTGNPVVLTRYGLAAGDSMNTYRLHYDSVTNTAKGIDIVKTDILLDNSGASPAWGDTLSNGMYEAKAQLGATGVGVPVAAGYLIGASVSFISGDGSFVAHDTVFGTSIGYKYNMFRPYTISRASSTAYAFPSYDAADRNNGIFKSLPDTANGWGGQYIPQWFWSASTGGASSLQYPLIDFHIVCATCGLLTDAVAEVGSILQVNAYPNPATNEVTIPFTLKGNANVTVTLSNMMGQRVAVKEIANTASGKAIFNTALLPAGLYAYTIQANGHKSTGRVAVMH